MPILIRKIAFILLAVFSILISFYPISYFIQERTFGLLQFKSPELLQNTLWNIFFYAHIIPGGIALLVGWSQFSKNFRKKRMSLHRLIGKVYVIAVMISSISGIYISFSATGGLVSKLGFMLLGLIWFSSTAIAFQAIRNGKVETHQKFMIYSYAACFAAVTLRLWMPILMGITAGDFIPAYKIVAWLSWVPNLLVAYTIVQSKKGLGTVIA